MQPKRYQLACDHERNQIINYNFRENLIHLNQRFVCVCTADYAWPNFNNLTQSSSTDLTRLHLTNQQIDYINFGKFIVKL